jgi:hypothetical protein
MWVTWTLAVFGLMSSAATICGFDVPSAMRRFIADVADVTLVEGALAAAA